jgi:hypothetical protein
LYAKYKQHYSIFEVELVQFPHARILLVSSVVLVTRRQAKRKMIFIHLSEIYLSNDPVSSVHLHAVYLKNGWVRAILSSCITDQPVIASTL